MADAFISYSRRDQAFVRRLHEALDGRGRDTWVDWESIPLTAEWEAEIYAGIDAAQAFVFVLSPDSVRSEVCAREVAHAVRHQKRLVPLVCRDVDPATVSPAVAALNWIFCRAGDDFDRAVDGLLAAMDTDLEHVRLHTRLLVRALEWDAKHGDGSLLLRGGDLQEAEQWLLAAGACEPRPTPLQTQYILAGRRASARRQRVLFGGVTVALVVALALAALAWLQRDAALVAQARAEEQQARAERRFGDVRRLANSFMFEFHDAVENLSGATPARRLVVERALEYLDSLAQEAGGDTGLQRELLVAYNRVGDVQSSLNTANVGDLAGARASYERALEIAERLAAADPSSAQAQRDMAPVYHRVCWTGALSGVGTDVLVACDRAVALASVDTLFGIRDSRGLARALTGDVSGAIEDFRAFIEGAQANAHLASLVAKRRDWIATLEAGRDPFDATTLEALRRE